jgi:benzoylformate decarboxylase
VLGLQEASVVGMADGYAQATRNAGFVNLHSGAGVGNALGNIYTAHRNQTPLVITAGPAGALDPAAAGLSLRRARFRISAALCQIQRRAGARRRRAGGDRPRLLRRDAAALRADLRLDPDRRLDAPDAADRSPPVSRELGPDPEAMKALVTALSASKRPALVVGPGCRSAPAPSS